MPGTVYSLARDGSKHPLNDTTVAVHPIVWKGCSSQAWLEEALRQGAMA